MPDHLRPTNPIAASALLPGDPARAMALAQLLLAEPLMANHARGLWGYTGATPSGMKLTIQATGLGGPSIAIVVEELAGLGVRRGVRIGTCRGLDDHLAAGDLIVAAQALAADGHALGASGTPDEALQAALLAGDGVEEVTVASTDLYYDPRGEATHALWRESGARAVDLGTAATLAVGRRVGMAVASALVVSRGADGRALDDEELARASGRLGEIAAAALSAR